MSDNGLTYEEAGVDRAAARAARDRIRELAAGTRTEGVRSAVGSFGGRFAVDGPTDLVASADGVGTKLKVAFRSGRHGTVGEDLVNHCVDDLLTEGGEPLFFLDYFASGELDAETAVRVVEGIARGCRRNGCALLGGETAEMPDLYATGEYDLAGFAVGRVAWPRAAAREVEAGDRLVALEAGGLHTNGYTFARRVLFDRMGLAADDPWPGPEADVSVADVLLRVHRSYLPVLRGPLDAGLVRAIAHVTGGGLEGNLDRVLPGELDARVELAGHEPPEVFRVLQRESGASTAEMYRTFNMGVGMVAVVRPEDAEAVRTAAADAGCRAFDCGELVPGRGRVRLEGAG